MNRNKAALLSLSLLGLLAIDSVAPLVHKISASFPQVSPTIIKQTVTLPSLLAIFFGLLAGQLVRVLSKKFILLIGLVLFSIGGIGAGWAQNFTTHLLLRGVVGAGMGMVNPIRTSLIADYYQGEERANMFGSSLAFSKFIAIIIPPLSAWIGNENWRYSFFLYVIGPLIMVLTMTSLDAPIRKSQEVRSIKNKKMVPPIVFLYAFLALIMMSIFFVLVTDLTYLIETKEGISYIMSAYGLSAVTIGTTLAGVVFSRIFMKIKKWIIPLGTILCGGGFSLITNSMLTILILMGLLLIGLGFGLLLATIILSATNAVGEADSTAANSIVGTGISLGITTSPILFSFIPQFFLGLSPVESNFQLAGILFLGAGLLSLLVFILDRKNRISV